jgi:hypothetical protein
MYFFKRWVLPSLEIQYKMGIINREEYNEMIGYVENIENEELIDIVYNGDSING